MTTRTGARIYRAAPRPTQPGACPTCHLPARTTTTGRRRRHTNPDGDDCTGGGVPIHGHTGRPELDPDALAEALAAEPVTWGSLPERDTDHPSTTRMWTTPRRWSGKP